MILNEPHLYLGFLWLLATLLLICIVCRNEPECRRAALGAFAVRCAYALLVTVVIPEMDPDPDGFSAMAADIGQGDFISTVREFRTGAHIYSWIIAVLYSIFGESPYMIRQVNVAAATFACILTYRMSRYVATSRKAQTAAWIFALFPYSIVQTASFATREALIVLALMAGVYSYIRWRRDGKLLTFLLAVAAFALSVALHSGMIVCIAALVLYEAADILRALWRGELRTFTWRLISTVAALGGLLVLFASGWGLEKFGKNNERLSTTGIEQQQVGAAKGRTAYLEDYAVRTPKDVLTVLPVRVAYFFCAPFPWMVSEPRDVIGAADAVVYAWLLFRIMRNARRLFGLATIAISVGVTAATAVAFALSVSNYGTAMRHRCKLLPLLCVAALCVPDIRMNSVSSSVRRVGVRMVDTCREG